MKLPNKSYNDDIVIRDVLRGKKDEFRHLLNKYYEYVYAYVSTKIEDEQEVDDLVQKVFIDAFNNLKFYEKTISFKRELWKLANKSCRDHIDDKLKIEKEDQEIIEVIKAKVIIGLLDQEVEPDDDEKRLSVLEKCVEALRQDFKEIINYRFVHKMKCKDIGKIYKRTDISIRATLGRINKILKHCYEKNIIKNI
jgi:RNA polymerase sigma-70 factor (ECF subfamily)